MPYHKITIDGTPSVSMTPDRAEKIVFGYYKDVIFVQNGAGGWDRTNEEGDFPVYQTTEYWPNGDVTVKYSYEDNCESLRGCSEDAARRMTGQ